jgi:predicted MFS family arabinose efflux permease
MAQETVFKLLILILCYFLQNMSMSLIVPFFPPFATGRGVSLELVGLIISSNPIGAVIASLIIGKLLNEVPITPNDSTIDSSL